MDSRVTTSSVILIVLSLTSRLICSACRSSTGILFRHHPGILSSSHSLLSSGPETEGDVSSPPSSFYLCFLNKVLLLAVIAISVNYPSDISVTSIKL